MESTLTIDDGQALPVTKAGNGTQPVVLGHGWTCNRKHWQPLLDSAPAGTPLTARPLYTSYAA